MKRCPVCRQAWPVHRRPSPMLDRLEKIGSDAWVEVAVGASRYYRKELERRYPGWEFRHERVSLFAGPGSSWRVEARRLQKGGKPCLKIVPGS